MALPTLSKTWRLSPNNVIPAAASAPEVNRRVWLAILKALQGKDYLNAALSWVDTAGAPAAAPAAFWTVSGSCDGAGSFGNNDDVDRIVDETDVVWGGSGTTQAHSWATLKHASYLSTQFLMSAHDDGVFQGGQSGGNTSWMVATPGFGAANGGVNGSNILTPAAAAGQFFVSWASGVQALGTGNQAWLGAPGIESHRMHIWCTSDGKDWRIVVQRNGFTAGILILDSLVNPVTIDPLGTPHTVNGQDEPFAAIWLGADSNASANRATRAGAWQLGQIRFQGFQSNTADSTLMTPRSWELAVEFLLQSLVGGYRLNVQGTNDLYGLFPVAMHNNQSGYKGRIGLLSDLWLGPDTDLGVAEGDNYPDDLSRQFVQMGIWTLPGFGGVFQTS